VRGFNPIRAQVRLQGQRGKATPALVLVPGDPRAMAEAQLGPLAAFDLIDPVPEPVFTGPKNPAPVFDLAAERLFHDGMRKAAEQRRIARDRVLAHAPPAPVSGGVAMVPEPAPRPVRRLVMVPRVVPLPELLAGLGEPLSYQIVTRPGRLALERMAGAAREAIAAYKRMTERDPDAWA
jgi:hypothetical protein